MENNEKEIFTNRANFSLINDKIVAEDTTADEMEEEELVFALKQGNHAFSLGLTTVLTCVAIAEKEGYVPKIPEDWWLSIRQF